MAKKDYDQLAKDVVAHVGGKENIVDVTNCMTRLRFVLKDDAAANESALKQMKQVKGIMNKGGQYQVIIGTEVSDIAPVVRDYMGAGNVTATAGKSEAKEGSLFDRFFKVISGCRCSIVFHADPGRLQRRTGFQIQSVHRSDRWRGHHVSIDHRSSG